LYKTNYFLYIVGAQNNKTNFMPGDMGAGSCTMGPGIFDAPYGTMYIISNRDFANRTRMKSPSAYQIRDIILEFYGIK
jgi:hypothetical protein